jgi:hypothetical protein
MIVEGIGLTDRQLIMMGLVVVHDVSQPPHIESLTAPGTNHEVRSFVIWLTAHARRGERIQFDPLAVGAAVRHGTSNDRSALKVRVRPT